VFYRLNNKQIKLLSIHRKEKDKYRRDENYDRLNEEIIVKFSFTLTKFHTKKRTEYSSQCRRSMESFYSIIEQNIKK